MACQGSIPNFFDNFPILFQNLAAKNRSAAVPARTATTVDALTMIAARHLRPAFLGRLAEGDGGVVEEAINAGFDGDQSELEHVRTFRVGEVLII